MFMLVVKSQMLLFTCLVQQSCWQPASHMHRTHVALVGSCIPALPMSLWAASEG